MRKLGLPCQISICFKHPFQGYGGIQFSLLQIQFGSTPTLICLFFSVQPVRKKFDQEPSSYLQRKAKRQREREWERESEKERERERKREKERERERERKSEREIEIGRARESERNTKLRKLSFFLVSCWLIKAKWDIQSTFKDSFFFLSAMFLVSQFLIWKHFLTNGDKKNSVAQYWCCIPTVNCRTS